MCYWLVIQCLLIFKPSLTQLSDVTLGLVICELVIRLIVYVNKLTIDMPSHLIADVAAVDYFVGIRDVVFVRHVVQVRLFVVAVFGVLSSCLLVCQRIKIYMYHGNEWP